MLVLGLILGDSLSQIGDVGDDNWSKPSPTPKTCHQLISSPAPVAKIYISKFSARILVLNPADKKWC